MQKISKFAEYINLIRFFKSHGTLYYIIYNLIIAIILINIIFIFVLAIKMKKKELINFKIVTIFKFIIPIFTELSFTQIFSVIISILYCDPETSYSYFGPSFFSGVSYKIEIVLCIIAIILYICISYISISIYFKTICDEGKLKKFHTLPDKIFLLTKIIIIFFHMLLIHHIKDTYIPLIICSIITFINSYIFIKYKSCNDPIINLIHEICSLILFWGFCSLLLGKIFNLFTFNGTSYLFLVGILLSIIYIIAQKNNITQFFMIDFSHINSPIEYIYYISNIVSVFDTKNISRESSILLGSLIERREKICQDPFCVFKSYINSLEKGLDVSILLYLYCRVIFKFAISKYNKEPYIKILYVYFLIKKLNKRKEAEIVLGSVDKNVCSIEELFLYYRCKKFFEMTSLESSKLSKKKKLNKDIVDVLEYSKNLAEFSCSLLKISSLYHEFWSCLKTFYLSGIKNFDVINNVGIKIEKMINPIKENFSKLYNIKHNNRDLNRIYYNFIENILNDERSKEKYNEIYHCLYLDNFQNKIPMDYSNFDVMSLTDKDDIQYLVISEKKENEHVIGTIQNMSLSLSPIIGYQRSEIIGKNINEIIPQILKDSHTKMLYKLTNDIKTNFNLDLSNNVKYIPDVINVNSYCVNKSKCLIPFNFQAIYVQNEQNDQLYILNVSKKTAFPSTYNKEKDEKPLCCVLTDKNFLIQSFTANAFEYLDLNTNHINAKIDICSFIKQIQEELSKNEKQDDQANNNILDCTNINESSRFLTLISNNTTISNINLNLIDNENYLRNKKVDKTKIIKEKYFSSQIITWKILTENNNLYEDKNNEIKSQNRRKSVANKSYKETDFEMIVKECKISNELLGYKFLFKKLYEKDSEMSDKYNIILENIKPESNIMDSIFFENSITPSKTNSIKTIDKNTKIKNKNIKSSFINCQKIHLENNENNTKIFDKNLEELESAKNTTFLLENACEIIDNKKDFIIDKNYIPNSTFNFELDITDMSFKGIPTLNYQNKTTNLNEKLKQESLDKINKQNENPIIDNEKFSSNNSSKFSDSIYSENDSEDSESDDSKEDSSENESNKKNNENELNNENTNINPRPTIFSNKSGNINNHFNKNNNYISDYYKVNLSTIRFMVFDFNKDVINENENFEKISKMEEILKNKQKQIVIGDDETFPYINTEIFINSTDKKTKKKIEKRETENQYIQKIQEEKNKLDKKLELENEINESINKKERMFLVNILIMTDILFGIILIGIGILNFVWISFKLDIDENNLKMVCNSSLLGVQNNFALYFLRELSLLNYPLVPDVNYGEYTLIPYKGTKEDYFNKMSNELFESYNTLYYLTQNILNSNLKLSTDTENVLNKDIIESYLYLEDLSGIPIKTTFFGFLAEMNSQLFNLATNPTTILETNIDFRSFLLNFANIFEMKIKGQITLLIDEITIRKKENIKKVIFLVFIQSLILIILLIILYIFHSKVIKKKNSFFDLFFGIGLTVVENSMDKCEIFINQLKKLDLEGKLKKNGNKENINDENNSFASSKNNNDKYFMNNNSNTKKNQKIEAKNIHNNKKSNKKYYKDSLIYIMIKIIILIISISFFILNFYLYFSKVDRIYKNGKYIFHFYRLVNYIPSYFNVYREFLINDKRTVLEYLTTYELLDLVKNDLYSIKSTDLNAITKYSTSVKNFNIDDGVKSTQELCIFRSGDYFSSTEECTSYMYGIMAYDFNIVSNSFYEEIATHSKIVKYYLSQNNIIDIADVKKMTSDERKGKNFRFIFFNDDNISSHNKLNVIFSNIFIPYLKISFNITSNTIVDSFDNANEDFFIMFLIYYLVIFIILFCIILPMVVNINSTLTKAKKILKIIPINILVNLKGVNEVLNLVQSNNIYYK